MENMEDKYNDHVIDQLTANEKTVLLDLARQALRDGVIGKPLKPLELSELPPRLKHPGATFVTLTIKGELRGCIGSLEAKRPLAEDVRYHAVAAALEDYRFPPVEKEEIPHISIEISRLTEPQKVQFNDPDALLTILRPGVDGVILVEGVRRATFLPQVWAKVPDAETFLSMLSRKMGKPSNYWRGETVNIFKYQVEEFHE
jgi:AmmeMemoRadiSam system protein A